MSEQKRAARLSRGEWALMNLCWKRGKATARQIYEDSLDRRQRDYRTVKTMLDRMAVKGFLDVEKLGPLCLYTPAVPKREALAGAIHDFFDVVLDRTLSPLLLHLAGEEELSDEDLETLRRLVESKRREEES